MASDLTVWTKLKTVIDGKKAIQTEEEAWLQHPAARNETNKDGEFQGCPFTKERIWQPPYSNDRHGAA